VERMREISKRRLFRYCAAILVVTMTPIFLLAQDDGAETPLGDVARNLRKKTPAQAVIDNDNLGTVMEQVQIHKLVGTAVQYSIDGGGKTFQISSPDASCRLSFSANSKALLSNQYTQMQLPPADLAKLAGPAIIDGSSLQVSMFNGTNWHVSEVAIALTLVTRSDVPDTSARSRNNHSLNKVIPAIVRASDQVSEKPAEKTADVTMLYRVRAAAAPATTTLFSTPLTVEVGPDQEWHWAIVEAKGYPPQRVAQANAATDSR
jgi:hypothetical protein